MTNSLFSGSIEFKLTIRAFDECVIRKALVNACADIPRS